MPDPIFENPRLVTITSNSTLRFRERAELEASLRRTGYTIRELRGAPDRPGKEFVFIARAEG